MQLASHFPIPAFSGINRRKLENAGKLLFKPAPRAGGAKQSKKV